MEVIAENHSKSKWGAVDPSEGGRVYSTTPAPAEVQENLEKTAEKMVGVRGSGDAV